MSSSCAAHEVFPAEQVLVLIYDDFRRENQAVVRAVLRHLEVDDTAPISVRQVNPTVTVRARRLHELTHALATGRGPLARATRASATALAPRRLNHESAIAIRNRIFFTAPPPRAATPLQAGGAGARRLSRTRPRTPMGL
jgi:hypothetical protein